MPSSAGRREPGAGNRAHPGVVIDLHDLLGGDPVAAAPRLLGCTIRSRVGGVTTSVRLTEVEAYRQDDPASHSHRGITASNRTMFDRGGLLYVYRSYGIHWCANVVTGPPGEGAAILLRGGVPVDGVEEMTRRRGRADHLTDGPGKLCQALGLDGSHDGLDLLDPSSSVELLAGDPPGGVEATPRIGISRAVDRPWRFMARSGEPARG